MADTSQDTCILFGQVSSIVLFLAEPSLIRGGVDLVVDQGYNHDKHKDQRRYELLAKYVDIPPIACKIGLFRAPQEIHIKRFDRFYSPFKIIQQFEIDVDQL